MASISENSFGKRLDNANALATHIQSFGNYTELNAELSLASLNGKITSKLLLNSNPTLLQLTQNRKYLQKNRTR